MVCCCLFYLCLYTVVHCCGYVGSTPRVAPHIRYGCWVTTVVTGCLHVCTFAHVGLVVYTRPVDTPRVAGLHLVTFTFTTRLLLHGLHGWLVTLHRLPRTFGLHVYGSPCGLRGCLFCLLVVAHTLFGWLVAFPRLYIVVTFTRVRFTHFGLFLRAHGLVYVALLVCLPLVVRVYFTLYFTFIRTYTRCVYGLRGLVHGCRFTVRDHTHTRSYPFCRARLLPRLGLHTTAHGYGYAFCFRHTLHTLPVGWFAGHIRYLHPSTTVTGPHTPHTHGLHLWFTFTLPVLPHTFTVTFTFTLPAGCRFGWLRAVVWVYALPTVCRTFTHLHTGYTHATVAFTPVTARILDVYIYWFVYSWLIWLHLVGSHTFYTYTRWFAVYTFTHICAHTPHTRSTAFTFVHVCAHDSFTFYFAVGLVIWLLLHLVIWLGCWLFSWVVYLPRTHVPGLVGYLRTLLAYALPVGWFGYVTFAVGYFVRFGYILGYAYVCYRCYTRLRGYSSHFTTFTFTRTHGSCRWLVWFTHLHTRLPCLWFVPQFPMRFPTRTFTFTTPLPHGSQVTFGFPARTVAGCRFAGSRLRFYRTFTCGSHGFTPLHFAVGSGCGCGWVGCAFAFAPVYLCPRCGLPHHTFTVTRTPPRAVTRVGYGLQFGWFTYTFAHGWVTLWLVTRLYVVYVIAVTFTRLTHYVRYHLYLRLPRHTLPVCVCYIAVVIARLPVWIVLGLHARLLPRLVVRLLGYGYLGYRLGCYITQFGLYTVCPFGCLHTHSTWLRTLPLLHVTCTTVGYILPTHCIYTFTFTLLRAILFGLLDTHTVGYGCLRILHTRLWLLLPHIYTHTRLCTYGYIYIYTHAHGLPYTVVTRTHLPVTHAFYTFVVALHLCCYVYTHFTFAGHTAVRILHVYLRFILLPLHIHTVLPHGCAVGYNYTVCRLFGLFVVHVCRLVALRLLVTFWLFGLYLAFVWVCGYLYDIYTYHSTRLVTRLCRFTRFVHTHTHTRLHGFTWFTHTFCCVTLFTVRVTGYGYFLYVYFPVYGCGLVCYFHIVHYALRTHTYHTFVRLRTVVHFGLFAHARYVTVILVTHYCWLRLPVLFGLPGLHGCVRWLGSFTFLHLPVLPVHYTFAVRVHTHTRTHTHGSFTCPHYARGCYRV